MVAGEPVDGPAGLIFWKQVGDEVQPGDVLVQVYTNESQEQADAALKCIQQAVELRSEPPTQRKGPIVTHRVTKEEGTQPFVIPSFLHG